MVIGYLKLYAPWVYGLYMTVGLLDVVLGASRAETLVLLFLIGSMTVLSIAIVLLAVAAWLAFVAYKPKN